MPLMVHAPDARNGCYGVLSVGNLVGILYRSHGNYSRFAGLTSSRCICQRCVRGSVNLLRFIYVLLCRNNHFYKAYFLKRAPVLSQKIFLIIFFPILFLYVFPIFRFLDAVLKQFVMFLVPFVCIFYISEI